MAREVKPLILKTVDDDELPVPVIRLGDEIPEFKKEVPVRLGASGGGEDTRHRLDVLQSGGEALRTHQPGIEEIIEKETVNTEALEQNWGHENIQRRPLPWGWFALVGLALSGALLWSLRKVENAALKVDQVRNETENSLADDKNEEKEAIRLVDSIENTVRQFFSATSVDGMLRVVRHSKRVEPMMRSYYGNNPLAPGRLRSIKSMQPVTLDNHGDLWVATVDLGESRPKNLIVEIVGSGEPRVDWETAVCYQPMKWDEFATGRPAGNSMDFRVYVERDDFFSHEFADSSRWKCFRLTALDADETLFGYVRAGSAEAGRLDQLLEQNGGKKASLILKLLVPENLQSRRGVIIEKIMSPRWLYIDPPDTDS